MIDTTTVNYALDKMADAYRAIAPTVGQISEKYVTYVVSKQVILAVSNLMGLIVCLGAVALCLWAYARGERLNKEPFVAFGIAGGVIFGVVSLFLGVGTLINGREAIVAILNPEMYAVEQVIRDIKK